MLLHFYVWYLEFLGKPIGSSVQHNQYYDMFVTIKVTMAVYICGY